MIEVHGSGDDLIEIEGAIEEEFPYDDRGCEKAGDLLAFSDGTVLRIRYSDEGVWRIELLHRSQAGNDVVIAQCPVDDPDRYTDRATISGAGLDIRWVVRGDAIASGSIQAVTRTGS